MHVGMRKLIGPHVVTNVIAFSIQNWSSTYLCNALSPIIWMLEIYTEGAISIHLKPPIREFKTALHRLRKRSSVLLQPKPV